jgi:hypothetical protein
MAHRIQQGGVVLADEVGTGKTRIACAVVHAVLEAGGRAAVVVPHGLMHQWVAESRKLREDGPAPKGLTTFTEFLREVCPTEDSWQTCKPQPDQPEWWLISHGFRAPLVRSNSEPWRAALPALVGLNLASRAGRQDGRTRPGRLQTEIENASASWWGWNGMARIARDVAPYVRRRRDLRKEISLLPPFKGQSANNDDLLSAFGSDGDGRQVTEEILGLWLGEFDLVVIDEAHKGRGEVDVDGTALGAVEGTVLARLVDVVLKQPEDGRRLCLTATPMELALSQWLDLLARARSGLNLERGHQVVQRLHDAAERAAVAPDEGDRLDELCNAAQDFQRVLSPYVTRRRRDEDPLIASFRAGAHRLDGLPHPHRNVEPVKIGWAQTVGRNSAWLDALFAAECMSQSARGLSLAATEGWPRAVRDAYTKLSAGHVSIDLIETGDPLRVPEPGVIDDHTRGKIARVAYWYRRLRAAHRKVVEEFEHLPGVELDPDSEHPRILAAVKEIENWTAQREKVLVFGVFLRPLRLLRDVLNVRHALRAADAGRPIAHAVHKDKALLGIAVRQVDRLRDEGVFVGRLVKGDHIKMRRALRDSHKAYERLRRQVREGAKKPIKAWCADRTILGGAAADRELETAIQDHLVTFLLDDLLATISKSSKLTPERLSVLAASFLEHQVRPILGELGDEDGEDEEQAELRQAALRRAFLEDEENDGRQSLHARLLQGATRWETRRYLQAAFNRPGASPWVLVAQSQVGREGLNLHESCRVVVQFHAEWNPAVLEQQIGRVDRKGSLWEQCAQKWLEGGTDSPPPFVEVRQLVFEGTYDAFQWDRVMRRQHVFDASLFGALLPAESWVRVPSDQRQKLIDAAPSFSPEGTSRQ